MNIEHLNGGCGYVPHARVDDFEKADVFLSDRVVRQMKIRHFQLLMFGSSYFWYLMRMKPF